MTRSFIKIDNLSVRLPQKVLFDSFSYIIPYGMRVALIGNNGSGKSTFLKLFLQEESNDSSVHIDGWIHFYDDIPIFYVEQLISTDGLSGAENFF